MSDFEKCELPGSHEIKSDSVLICSETGRVVAVFYNDYDLDSVLSQLEAATQQKGCEWVRAFDGHFNISCVGETGARANWNFKGKDDGAKWEFKYCPYCSGEVTVITPK